MITIIPKLIGTLKRLRSRSIAGPAYPSFVGVAAFASTVSMTLPFGPVLVAAVLLTPSRWRSSVVGASVGSSIGALVLYLVFHHLGWSQFLATYPEVATSAAWTDASKWLSTYGVMALFAITALPLPQTPALAFTAIFRMPVGEVWLAILGGKLLKYGAYAFAIKLFPNWFAARYRGLLIGSPAGSQGGSR